jgi:hypothetical protein
MDRQAKYFGDCLPLGFIPSSSVFVPHLQVLDLQERESSVIELRVKLWDFAFS